MKETVSILGCGWLGLALAEKLLTKGYIVKGTLRNPLHLQGLRTKGIDAYILDLEANDPDIELFDNLLSAGLLLISIPPKGDSSYWEQFVPLLDRLKTRPYPPKVIFLSSTSVYGGTGIIDESAMEFSIRENPIQLLKAEHIFQEYLPKRSVVLRLAGLAGPNRNPGNFLAGKKNVPNPKAGVNFIHQKDVVEILIQLISGKWHAGIFNLSAPLHPSRKEFYTHFSEQLELPIPTFKLEEKETVQKIISSQKLITELGYSFYYENPMNFEF